MNKKILMFSLLGVFALTLVTGALVEYWGQTQVDVEVRDSFEVYENTCEFSVVGGDGQYKLCPFDATNNLDRPLDVDFELRVQKWNDGLQDYENLDDTAGVYVGFSEDLQYAYDSDKGQCTDWTCAEAWMLSNADWFDWYLTQSWEGYYDTSVITNDGGNSVTTIPLTNGGFAFTETVPENYEIHSVIYLGSGLNLEAGNYRVALEVLNVAESN